MALCGPHFRGFYSPDIADLEAYQPKDGDNFHVAITAFVGR
jgi:hypothetical protein